eukprot:scaffold19737_cov129-Isochrysis_galbana.AAC.2
MPHERQWIHNVAPSHHAMPNPGVTRAISSDLFSPKASASPTLIPIRQGPHLASLRLEKEDGVQRGSTRLGAPYDQEWLPPATRKRCPGKESLPPVGVAPSRLVEKALSPLWRGRQHSASIRLGQAMLLWLGEADHLGCGPGEVQIDVVVGGLDGQPGDKGDGP